MKQLKIGILGLGSIGKKHLKNCIFMKNVNVVAVADASKAELAKAKNMGIRETYERYQDLLNNACIDAVIIALPNFLHKTSSCAAAEKGFDILIEKPLGRTTDECKTILNCAEKNDVKLMVGFNYRFLSCNQVIKSMIDEGVLGDIEFIVCEWVSSGPFSHRFPPAPVPEWWFDRKMVGGGVLLDMGSHMVDLTRWLVCDKASVDYVFLDHRFGLELEDSAILTLKFKGKSTKATLILGWFAREAVQKVNLYGTAGSVSSEELTPRNVMRHAAKEGIKNFARKLVGREIEPYAYSYSDKSYYQELKHFVDCIVEDKEPSVKPEDVVECAKLIDEAYEVWYNRMRGHDPR